MYSTQEDIIVFILITALLVTLFLYIQLRQKYNKAYSETSSTETLDHGDTFRAIAETLPLAIYVSSGEEQTCDYINPYFTKLFGYTIDEVPTVAEWWPLAYPDKDYQIQISNEWDEKVKNAIETQSDIEPMQVVVTSKSGDKHHIIWGFETLGGKNYAFGMDITESVLAEQQLRKDREAFMSLFQSAIDYALVLKIDSNEQVLIVDANKFALEKLGYTYEELIGKPLQLITEDKDKLELTQTLAIMKADKKFHAEFTRRCKDGTEFIASISCGVVEETTDTTILYSIEQDITQLKQDHNRIEKLSRVVINSTEAVAITDSHGKIEYINPAFTEITGYSQEEAIGENPRILKSGHQDDVYYERMWAHLKEGLTWQDKVINRKKNGDFYPSLLTISSIKNEHETIVNYVGVQQSLEEYDALESQLRQAQKMEAIGTLVGGIAHDFNNILMGVNGNIYLAGKCKDDSHELDKKLSNVEKLTKRATDLVKQLMVFSKNNRVEMTVINLNHFLNDFIPMVNTLLPENIEFDFKSTSSKYLIKADKTQLHQVLINLLNNAKDALEAQRSPKITLVVEKRSITAVSKLTKLTIMPGNYVYLSIRDNGHGIRPEIIENLFEPFFTTKDVGKGTGLGLAMVYGMVQNHGGHIEINSTVNVGTHIDIYLPFVTDVEAEVEDDDNDVEIHGIGELILLVDDDKSVREAGREVLESLSYKVIEASDGLDAVRQYIEHSDEIQLIISDIVMPNMSGPEAYEKIKTQFGDTKVIFVTGYENEAETTAGSLVGKETVLSKPFDVVEFSRKIREKLSS